MAARKALGKGLDALIPPIEGSIIVLEIPLADLRPNPLQPRDELEEDSLTELSESIKNNGVLQPILARPIGPGEYQVVAGQRRVEAARLAGLKVIPAYVREIPDNKVLIFALIENLQREDINPIEEAVAYKYLNEDGGISHDAIATAVGKHRATITNALRLLSLPEAVIEMLREGRLSSGHARALLRLQNSSQQFALAKRIEADGLSVRQVERIAKPSPPKDKSKKRKGDAFASDLEKRLSAVLATKVKVAGSKEKGSVTIYYYDPDDIIRLLKRFGLVD